MLRAIVERAQRLETTFKSEADSLIWNGREDEVISYFRDEYRRRVAQNGPFTIGAPLPAGFAGPPPSS